MEEFSVLVSSRGKKREGPRKSTCLGRCVEKGVVFGVWKRY